MNVWEAEAVVPKGHEISEVAGSSIKARHIYVITPYSGQAALLWTRSRGVALITEVEADSALEPMRYLIQRNEDRVLSASPGTAEGNVDYGYCIRIAQYFYERKIAYWSSSRTNDSRNRRAASGLYVAM